MKKFVIFITVFLLLGAGAAYFYLVYPEPSQGNDLTSFLQVEYALKATDPDRFSKIERPDLPDISRFTVDEIRQNIPAVQAGEVQVMPLEKAYPESAERFLLYGEKQRRLDPQTIAIRQGIYDLKTLSESLDPDVIKVNEGAFILNLPVVIGPEAALIIDSSDLILGAGTGGFIVNKGSLFILDSNISSDSEFEDAYEFRPYILSLCGSSTIVSESELSNLGFEGSGTHGVSLYGCSEDDGAVKTSGWFTDSSFKNNYAGLEVSQAKEIGITHNIIEDNIIYGFHAREGVESLIIAHNAIRESQSGPGLYLSKDVRNNHIFRNVVEKNALAGAFINEGSSDNKLVDNIFRANGTDGIVFYESGGNLSVGDIIVENKAYGVRARDSTGLVFYQDIISNNGLSGVHAYKDDMQGAIEITLLRSELSGNLKSHFHLKGLDQVYLSDLVFFRSPDRFFSGDLKNMHTQLFLGALQNNDGIAISKTASGTQ